MADKSRHIQQSWEYVLLRTCATALAVVYVLWNIAWLATGQLPTSLMMGLFRLPAPTTGMTRSLLALSQARYRDAVLWNPFTLPILVVLLGSLGFLLAQACRRKRLRLPPFMATTWLVILTLAWISKFILGAEYW